MKKIASNGSQNVPNGTEDQGSVEISGPTKRKPRLDPPLDHLRTKWWIESAMDKLSVVRAYAFERAVAPGGMRQLDDGTICHSNRWAGYRAARFVPQASAISMVEREVPGSARVFQHPLWSALRVDPRSERPRLAIEQSALPIEHRRIFYFHRPGKQYHPIGELLRDLPGEVDLDIVASLLWALREAVALSLSRDVHRIALTIYGVLLCWAVVAKERWAPLVCELIDIVRARAIPLANTQSKARFKARRFSEYDPRLLREIFESQFFEEKMFADPYVYARYGIQYSILLVLAYGDEPGAWREYEKSELIIENGVLTLVSSEHIGR